MRGRGSTCSVGLETAYPKKRDRKKHSKHKNKRCGQEIWFKFAVEAACVHEHKTRSIDKNQNPKDGVCRKKDFLNTSLQTKYSRG